MRLADAPAAIQASACPWVMERDRRIHRYRSRQELNKHTPECFAWYPPLNFLITIKGKVTRRLCQTHPILMPRVRLSSKGEKDSRKEWMA